MLILVRIRSSGLNITSFMIYRCYIDYPYSLYCVITPHFPLGFGMEYAVRLDGLVDRVSRRFWVQSPTGSYQRPLKLVEVVACLLGSEYEVRATKYIWCQYNVTGLGGMWAYDMLS